MLSLTSMGSASSGQQHSMSTLSVGSSISVPEQAQLPTETESPYTVLRAITRVRGKLTSCTIAKYFLTHLLGSNARDL